jgi:hypothetical protein
MGFSCNISLKSIHWSRGVLMLDHHSNWNSQRTFSTNHYASDKTG